MSSVSVAEKWRSQVIYQVFIDRFAGYDPGKDAMNAQFVGGNVRGVTENLRYIKELGATCVYLTPFLKGGSYHGYHVTDFFEIDERFGTLADIQELAAQAHALDLKVMIDLVPNHCYVEHPYFQDARRNPDSPYRDWFTFTQWPDRYLSFLNIDVLPKINLDNSQARQHILDSTAFWVEKLGIDAMRLDHVIGPSPEFWREFSARIKAIRPDIFLLAEVSLYNIDMRRHAATLQLPMEWGQIRRYKTLNERHRVLFAAYGDLFDGYIDFAFNEVIRDFATGEISETRAREILDRHYAGLPKHLVFPTQLDNHDHDRIMFITGDDVERVKAAISLQFSYNQPHLIYYGTEIGMSQDRPGGPLDDYYFGLPSRQPMPPLTSRPIDHELQVHYRGLAAGGGSRSRAG
jgi:cyclomaltodextrinase / maltogenic alpha-amylase / neopullulanase